MLARRSLQHIPIIILVSMLFEWTCLRFFPLQCRLLGFELDLRALAVALPLIVLAVVIFTFRHGRVFCSWFCPTHLYLEGTRWVAHRARGWSTPAEWLFAVVCAAFVTQALVTCFVPISDQVACLSAGDFSSPYVIVGVSLFAWFVVHFGLLRWRFCVYACPYGILMRLFKTDTTSVMKFDAESGRCVNCMACDRGCPYELNVRKESDGDICTNCGFCAKACHKVLGSGRGVLNICRRQDTGEDQA